MKKLLVIVLLMASFASANAQSDFYRQYSNVKGVTRVYISKAMFSLVGGMDNVKVNEGEINISSIAKDLNGLYILSTEDADIAASMKKDIQKYMDQSKMELLMEVSEDEDNVLIYVYREGDFITDLFLVAQEPDEFTVLNMAGRLSQEQLNEIIASSEAK